MVDSVGIRCRYEALFGHLNEQGCRLFAAAEARAAGWGGIKAVSEITGMAPSTIGRGLDELVGKCEPVENRVRRPGGGRKPAREKQPGLLEALERLVAPATRGDPGSALRWLSKSPWYTTECNIGKSPGGQAVARSRMRSGRGGMSAASGCERRAPR